MILDTFFNESKMFSDDTELNENYVDQIEAIALKESEHPVDACFRLTLENEQNWYNIFNTIAVSEMAFLEAHGNDDAIMYEAVDVKKIANTILTWVQTQFAKLKGAFEAAIKKISDAVNMDKKLVKEYEARKITSQQHLIPQKKVQKFGLQKLNLVKCLLSLIKKSMMQLLNSSISSLLLVKIK